MTRSVTASVAVVQVHGRPRAHKRYDAIVGEHPSECTGSRCPCPVCPVIPWLPCWSWGLDANVGASTNLNEQCEADLLAHQPAATLDPEDPRGARV